MGYTEEERHKSAERNVRLCKLLADQGIDVVCCTISMFDDIRKWSRDNNSQYFEVYLEVPLDILKKRNQKNLYADSQDELVGLGVGMEEPKSSDLRIINDGTIEPSIIADRILEESRDKQWI